MPCHVAFPMLPRPIFFLSLYGVLFIYCMQSLFIRRTRAGSIILFFLSSIINHNNVLLFISRITVMKRSNTFSAIFIYKRKAQRRVGAHYNQTFQANLCDGNILYYFHLRRIYSSDTASPIFRSSSFHSCHSAS